MAFFWYSFGLSISPLKHEFTIDPGKSLEASIKITNNDGKALTLYSSKEDFIAWDDRWTPKFIKPQDQTSTTSSLVNWISIDDEHITLAPGETREVKFKINVPSNWEPGWHYWAIFFSQWAGSGQVAVVSRLWVLILVNVNWEMKIDWNVEYIKFWILQWGDFKETNEFTGFPVIIDAKFKNSWNVHLKPEGSVVILDEKWDQLKKIWYKSDVTPEWVYKWEQLVDYIPVNDANWNVLSNSERTFELVWSWFGYKVVNEDWTKWAKFKTIEEYYQDQAKANNNSPKFWEMEKQVSVKKKFTAQINIFYKWKDWQKKEFNEQKDFYITYKETRAVINYWMIGGWFLIIIWFSYYLFVGKKNSEERLRQKIMAEMNKNQQN